MAEVSVVPQMSGNITHNIILDDDDKLWIEVVLQKVVVYSSTRSRSTVASCKDNQKKITIKKLRFLHFFKNSLARYSFKWGV